MNPNPTTHDYDAYISQLLAPEDDVLQATREEMQRAGLPQINVSASQGQTLHLLTRLIGAKRVLEIGTLGGYSAIWMARALPADGHLLSLEVDAHHASVARRNIENAGLNHQVEVRLGAASDTLRRLHDANEAPFDLIFIDADKDAYPQYLELGLPLLRDGGLLLADNTLSPEVLEGRASPGILRYNALAASHPLLVSTLIPVLRGRGVGGVMISIKQSPQPDAANTILPAT